MNNKGQKTIVLGFSLLMVGALVILTAFAFIDPIKDSLDNARDNSQLNCPGTLSFNQTDYDDDTTLERLTRRPTCFATGLTLVWFIGAVLIATVYWLFRNWRR